MFKNHVDNYKLDTSINLILQNSRKTIKNVKNYLAEPDELNLAFQDFGNSSSNRADLNINKIVNKTEVPPVWDENLHKMYIKSLVENYLSPRLSEGESRLNIISAPKNLPRNLSNEPVLKSQARNSKSNTNTNPEIILLADQGDNYDLKEQAEDLEQTKDLQWKPIKQNSEVRKTSNSKSILSGKLKKIEQQKIVSTDIPKASKTSDKNKKRTTTASKNINIIPNKKSIDIPDHSKMYSNSARSCRIPDGKNSKSSKIEPTFIRFIGKQTKNPIDFNKEHPGLLVEASENCKTLFPRRFLKSDTSNNAKEIETKINFLSSTKLQENKMDQKNNEKDRPEQTSKYTESKTKDNLRKNITTKSKSQILNSENKESNQESSKEICKLDNDTSKEMKKKELNQNLIENKKLNSERSALSRDEFAQRILDDFIEFQRSKSKIKKRTTKPSKLVVSADALSNDLQKNESECRPIIPDRTPDLVQNKSDGCNQKDISILENFSIRKQNDDPTWHEVLTDKNLEPSNPAKIKLSASSNNKTAEDKELSKADKNLEIIYDKSNRFEVKKVCISNNERLKKLQIKTLPVFCIRGECKVQKAISIEIKPIEDISKPMQNNNIQYSQFVHNNHNMKNNDEETDSNNINLIERMQPFANDIIHENPIRNRFQISNHEDINTGNFTFNAKSSLSTIDENDDANHSSENSNNFVNRDLQFKINPIIPGQKYSSIFVPNEQNLSAIDSNGEGDEISHLNTPQYKTYPTSNPILLTTSATSGILNAHLEETLSTQTDEVKLCMKNKSIASDTNLSEEDSSEIDSSIKISKQKKSSTSIDCDGKYQKNNETNQSTDFLSILENVFLKAFKSNTSSAKQSKESSSSSTRSLLDSSQYKRKEAIKKKYFDLAKKSYNSENIFKEVSVQTDAISNRTDFQLNQLAKQGIRENLVENIFEKIRNDVPAGLKEFKSYKQSKIEKFTLTNPDSEYEDYNKYDRIEKDFKKANQEIKHSILDQEKSVSNRASSSVFNDTQPNKVSSSSLISISSNDNKKNCTFRLNPDLDNLNSKLQIFDERNSEPNFDKQGKNNRDKLREHETTSQSKLETYSSRRLRNSSQSNLNTARSQASKKSNINENLLSNLNLQLDDGASSMFSLGSDGIVIDKINYQCRSSDKASDLSSKRNSQSNRKIQNSKISKTVEKVLKDGESFRSNTSQKYSKESKKNSSAEVQNAVKYFLDNLNSSQDSANPFNKNDKKTNNMFKMSSRPILHNTSINYITSINPDIKKQSKHALDLSNILGCSSKHNKTFDISEKSSETSSTDKLISNHSLQTKIYNLNKLYLNSYGDSSVSSQILKNDQLKKNTSFEKFLTKHVPDLSSNIDLNELYYSSTDDFLLSEQEQKKFVAKDIDSKNTGDILSVSDGEILSIGEIQK